MFESFKFPTDVFHAVAYIFLTYVGLELRAARRAFLEMEKKFTILLTEHKMHHPKTSFGPFHDGDGTTSLKP